MWLRGRRLHGRTSREEKNRNLDLTLKSINLFLFVKHKRIRVVKKAMSGVNELEELREQSMLKTWWSGKRNQVTGGSQWGPVMDPPFPFSQEMCSLGKKVKKQNLN